MQKIINNQTLYDNNSHIILPKRRQEPKLRFQCFYCGKWFSDSENIRGSCKEAPDNVEHLIRIFTCYPVAQAAVYHCCKSNGELLTNISHYGQGYNLFAFGSRNTSILKRLKRLLFVSLLSLIIPCLCCYFPAHVINKCFGGGKRGRHQTCEPTATTPANF
ncbi:unnamed protein product [Thelazia callipaeda]|uniref:LITAF domain-containing protein n=1 Tax=Thelazia callipaeda TaxID=103827 RepID=A0A0N5D4S9_THECL|nr:unnamed protein product [Thelazia callipaeda]